MFKLFYVHCEIGYKIKFSRGFFIMLIAIIIGCILGVVTAVVRHIWMENMESQQVLRTAQDIIQSSEDKKSLIEEQARSKIQEYEITLNSKFRGEIENLIKKNQFYQSSIDKINYRNKIQIQDIEKKIKGKQDALEILKRKLKDQFKFFTNLSSQKEKLIKQYVEILCKTFSFDLASIQNEMQSQFIQSAQERGQGKAQKIFENFEKDLEINVKRILEQVIVRFQQKACEERGIRAVYFKNIKFLKEILGPHRSHLNLIELKCGVDIVVDEQELSINVQGLDPVRREWGRFTVERLSKKRRISKGIVLNVIQQSKRDLFRKIRRDGNRVCHALNFKDVPLDVQNMMGALRYRYSFAQNQHFHCEEVGWLCGLLMAEFGENVDKGRRAGLFHDIGKAMDHAKPGGHAMIGADFIEKHGQEPDIVRAVRAHHNDVAPQASLDFLVIAADAISGSRPGARRSTVDSYNQKISSMEKIGKSFNGVQDIYVMNAGREIRVIVNSKQVNDLQALELSKKVAQRIEEECSYPGWIKVTVVRKTEMNQVTQRAG